MIPRRRAHVEPGEFRWVIDHVNDPDPGAVASFEAALAARAGVPHAAAVSSGRRSMALIFQGLGFQPGDEVIVPAYTLGSLVPLLQGLGLKVVPADIDARTLNLCPRTVAARITRTTRAILALHAFGNPCEIEPLRDLAARRGLALVEDCAHSLGASWHGRQTGSLGDAGFFSFETTKPVNTYGGGMVVTASPLLDEAVRAAAERDRSRPDTVLKKVRATRLEGIMFRSGLALLPLALLSLPGLKRTVNSLYRRLQAVPQTDHAYLPVQARLGTRKLTGLEDRVRKRQEAAERYRALLRPSIQTQEALPGAQPNWYFYVALLPVRAAPVRRALLLRGIDAAVGDEIADNCARLLGFDDCPAADQAFERAIALPMYDDIQATAVARTAGALNRLV